MLLVITIDTENPQTPSLAGTCDVDTIDLAVDGEPVGATRIARICERHGVPATFFVDVYEHGRIGEQRLASLCRGLAARGHDLQLHTHPVWIDDRGRRHMWQLSLEEQTEVVRTGAELLERWTGRRPLAHRAGAYGLNADTPSALRANGIRLDSSMFFGHDNCKLIWSRNAVVAREGILEIPVTGFLRRGDRRLGPVRVPGRTRFVKTDIDWCSLDELTWFVAAARASGLRVMNLFLHSYSLMKHDAEYRAFEPDPVNIAKLDRLLAYVAARPDVTVVTMAGLLEIHDADATRLIGTDAVPRYVVAR